MKKGTNTVTRCTACGAQMEVGQRVQVTFGWESSQPWVRSDGTQARRIVKASKSAKICKACAYAVLDMLGMERP